MIKPEILREVMLERTPSPEKRAKEADLHISVYFLNFVEL